MKNYEKHIDLMELDESGIKREVAVLKRWKDGSVSYIQVDTLDKYDVGRIRSAIEGPLGDKYELHEILALTKLNNGMNALDFFHQLAKVKRPDGTRALPQSRRSVRNTRATGTGNTIGAEFSDPTSAAVDNDQAPSVL